MMALNVSFVLKNYPSDVDEDCNREVHIIGNFKSHDQQWVSPPNHLSNQFSF